MRRATRSHEGLRNRMEDRTLDASEGATGGMHAALDLGAPAAKAEAGYRVLARKYRPATFDDLIGQDAMVRTLSNAFETGRIAQAYMLTGVRGVGKTTTARIVARALNYETADGAAKPTIHMPGLGVHCQAIMESRHVDVVEMDAASHTGINDIREIIDGVRYRPVSARYKVYIIDEVHMLSTQAFNGLLKTLEEPPEHVKFIFATTEIRKVPVTVLSRCQRFDLRRVDAALLVQHLGAIAAKESVSADPEALALIARAAEGSVRDSLSLFDQAIAHASGAVSAETVRGMLGLADRARVIDLFEHLMRGRMPDAFAGLRDLYDAGAEPSVVLAELAEFCHLVTRVKVAAESAKDPALTETERKRAPDFAAGLSMRVLSRCWQMLLKGIAEVQNAPRPIDAAEMVLVRIAHAADLPTPDEALRALRDAPEGISGSPGDVSGGGDGPRAMRVAAGGATATLVSATSAPRAARPAAEPVPGITLASLADVSALAAEKRDLVLRAAIERDLRLVAFEEGHIAVSLAEGASPGLAGELGRRLTEWTGRRWIVSLSKERGQPSLREVSQSRQQAAEQGIRGDPLVQTVLSKFPGAQILEVRLAADAPAPEMPIAQDTSEDDDEI